MKIGIISDSHDNLENLKKVLKLLKKKDVDDLIHCGDLCSPFVIESFADFKGEVYCLAGNVCDRVATEKICSKNGIEFYDEFAELSIDGRKIAVVHSPEIAEGLAMSGKYDAVFYGHSHIPDAKRIGKTLLVNPGEVMGRKDRPSFAIYETEDNSIKHFAVR